MRRDIAIDAMALTEHYELQLAGAICSVATNSATVVKALSVWPAPSSTDPGRTFSMQVLVTDLRGTDLIHPHFRGLHHLVIATFGAANTFIFDLARRNITAAISKEIAGDDLFWNRLLLPIALGVLGPAVGVVPMHCACLSIAGTGILIGGASGAGKSTLSVALAQHDFDFISDDWTYLSETHGSIIAHGLSLPAKLLPDAVDYFPELAGYQVQLALNQELAYELPPRSLGSRVQLFCKPQLFILLERTTNKGCRIAPLCSRDGQDYVQRSVERLPRELHNQIRTRSEIIARLAHLSCWRLTYGGPPRIAVKGMQRFLSQEFRSLSA